MLLTVNQLIIHNSTRAFQVSPSNVPLALKECKTISITTPKVVFKLAQIRIEHHYKQPVLISFGKTKGVIAFVADLSSTWQQQTFKLGKSAAKHFSDLSITQKLNKP